MNSENKNDFKRLLHTMLPLVLAQLSLMGMNVMDATMSGHAGPVDLAGVSMGASLFMPVTASFTGILAASTPMIAQLLGRRRKQDIPHVVRTGMALGMLLTALFALIYFLAIDRVMSFLSLDSGVARIATVYLMLMIANLFFQTIMFPLRALIDTSGSTATSMKLMLSALPINGLLNYMFIFGRLGAPRLGGIGAGVATVCTAAILFGMFLCVIFHNSKYMAREIFSDLTTPWSDWKECFTVGIPNGLSILMEAGLFGFIIIFIAPFGTVAIGAHQSALSFCNLIYVLPMSCSMAMTILVGYEVGAENYERARKLSRMGLKLTLCCAFLTAAGTVLGRNAIADLYSEDPQVIRMAGRFLLYGAAWQLFDAIAAPIQGILRGYKDTRVPFLLMLIAYWCVALPVGLFLDHVMGQGVIAYWRGLDSGVGTSACLMVCRLLIEERNWKE